jgi:hypothetical protein
VSGWGHLSALTQLFVHTGDMFTYAAPGHGRRGEGGGLLGCCVSLQRRFVYLRSCLLTLFLECHRTEERPYFVTVTIFAAFWSKSRMLSSSIFYVFRESFLLQHPFYMPFP